MSYLAIHSPPSLHINHTRQPQNDNFPFNGKKQKSRCVHTNILFDIPNNPNIYCPKHLHSFLHFSFLLPNCNNHLTSTPFPPLRILHCPFGSTNLFYCFEEAKIFFPLFFHPLTQNTFSARTFWFYFLLSLTSPFSFPLQSIHHVRSCN